MIQKKIINNGTNSNQNDTNYIKIDTNIIKYDTKCTDKK